MKSWRRTAALVENTAIQTSDPGPGTSSGKASPSSSTKRFTSTDIVLRHFDRLSIGGFRHSPSNITWSSVDSMSPDASRQEVTGKGGPTRACEAQFGSMGARGDLSGSGAPRWRQRAFYDYLKDLSPMVIATPMARIAIWDKITDGHNARAVAVAVRNPSSETARALAALLRKRAGRRDDSPP